MKYFLLKNKTAKCAIFLFSLLFFTKNIFTATWNGITVTNDVVDEDIDVSNENFIQGPIHVTADGTDVNVNVQLNDSIIRSDSGGNRGRLYFSAAANQKITFNIENNLDFLSSTDGQDFLISFTGQGEFEFIIDDNIRLNFGEGMNGGGTRAFIGMANSNIDEPRVIFTRQRKQSISNIEVRIGQDSCFTFLALNTVASGNATARSTVQFDVGNEDLGCFILRIANTGCFVVEGSWVDIANFSVNYDFSDIDLSQPAGALARMVINNVDGDTLSNGSLQLINENIPLTQLLINPFMEPSANYEGIRYGFILAANGSLVLNDITYLDYIGTTTNSIPNPEGTPCIEDCADAARFLKARNGSAFWVDGNTNENATPAEIVMNGSSAIYFRSGVDDDGEVNEAQDFIIDPDKKTPGAGNIVFDVEGLLEVEGDPDGNNGLSVLSLQVTKTGCPVFVESDETEFPQRTFARDMDDDYLIYNSGAFLINNRMNLRDASIIHTDENHPIFERCDLGRSDLASAPTYIGGETFQLCGNDGARPTIALYNSIIRFNTDAGFTGVDILVPNLPGSSNVSDLKFYYNGRKIDNGTGRYVIFGTNEGSYAADGGSVIDNSTYLDIFQTTEDNDPGTHELQLLTCPNSNCITEGITSPQDIEGQCVIQSIYLGNASNISIGTSAANNSGEFTLTTMPTLDIAGDFFAFETQGGSANLPSESGTTGEGGIFVDQNGTITIEDFRRASMATMVVKSLNGVVNLPKNQVLFDSRVRITNWLPNLANSDERIFIPANQCLSDFSIDWMAVTKDYMGTDSFVPYELKNVPGPCDCPPVTEANLRALPIIQGTVGQLQILRSRLGDMVHFKVDGGNVRELVFLTGCNSAQAPTGFVVLENAGKVGLGTTHRNVDSLEASIVLGINGVTVCPNNDGDAVVVEVNEDIIIDNVCHIVTGTAFGATSQSTLRIHSQDEKEIRVLNTGVLDLSEFDNDSKVLEFAGEVRLVMEPGARLIMGGGILVFTDNAELVLERVLDDDKLSATTLQGLDDVRVKVSGRGSIIFEEFASCLIHKDAFMGIETFQDCDLITSITWTLTDQAQFQIGNDAEPGGAFQVGNTEFIDGASVNFFLNLNGRGTEFQINRQGFCGLGVGMVDKASSIPNEWLVGCLENVNQIGIDIIDGTIRHNQIFTGDDSLAALFAIGPANEYIFTYDDINSRILGGGNMVLLENCLPPRVKALRKRNKDMFKQLPEIRVKAEEELNLDRIDEMREKGIDTYRVVLEPNAYLTVDGGATCFTNSSPCDVTIAGEDLEKVYHCLSRTMMKRSRRTEHIIEFDINKDNYIDVEEFGDAYRQLAQNNEIRISLQDGAQIRVEGNQLILTNNSGTQITFNNDQIMLLESAFMTDSDLNTQRLGNDCLVNPIVQNTAGQITDNLEVGLFSSKPLLDDTSTNQPSQGSGKSSQDLFDFLTTKDHDLYNSPKTNIGPRGLAIARLGFVSGGTIINRPDQLRILGGTAADPVSLTEAISRGAAHINIDDLTGDINNVIAFRDIFLGTF